MANGNGKKKTDPGWGEEAAEQKPAAAEQEPLTDTELLGLRTILSRHGFNRDTGTF